MFSTVVFSGVLLLCLSALVQIGRMYYKGVTTAQTQQSARSLLDELSQSMQFTGANIRGQRSLTGTAAPVGPTIAPQTNPTNGAIGFFCLGHTRYTFVIDRQQSSVNDGANKKIKHALWADEPGICDVTNDTVANLYSAYPVDLTADIPSTYNGRDLLSENMRITRFSMAPLSDNSIWRISLTVAYGDDDLLIVDAATPSRRVCKGGSSSAGSEFCAISELSTVVKRRISVQ